MKKFIIALLLLGFVFVNANSERNNRINLTLDLSIGFSNTDINDEKKDMVLVDLGTTAEYLRILSSGWIFGGSIQVKSISYTWYKTLDLGNKSVKYQYDTEGTSLQISPIIGKAFGENQNLQLLLYPLMLDSVSLTHIKVTNNSNTISQSDIDINYTVYKTGFRVNFQWGSNLVRNGFYIGTNIIWGASGDSDNSSGVEFPMGYKISFAF